MLTPIDHEIGTDTEYTILVASIGKGLGISGPFFKYDLDLGITYLKITSFTHGDSLFSNNMSHGSALVSGWLLLP